MKKMTALAAISAGLIFAVIAIGASDDQKPNAVAKPPIDPELQVLGNAAYACKQWVTESLNDPDSAEFVDEDSWFRKRLSDTDFQVIVQLRAKNAFNATMYAEMDCRLKLLDGNWQLESIKQKTP